MPQKSMLIKVLLAIAVKLAIVVAAVYWLWPTPKPVMPPQRVEASVVVPPFG